LAKPTFDRLLDGLARLCLRHSKRIAIIALFVAAAAIWGASRISSTGMDIWDKNPLP